MTGSEQQKAARPVPVARASMVWDNLELREQGGPVPAAASVRRRIAAERARVGRGIDLEVRPTASAAGLGLLLGGTAGGVLG